MKYACVIQCLTVSGIFLFLLADLIVKFVQTQGNVSGAFNAFLKKINCSSNINTIVVDHE